MRKSSSLVIFLLLMVISPLKAVESIGFYYNKIDSARELINYDRVVVNPHFLSDRQLAVLHKAETRVFAYLSIGELDLLSLPSSLQQYKQQLASIPHSINPVWQSRIVDQTSRIWGKHLLSQSEAFLERGFDGIFLDTVDSYQALSEEQFEKTNQKKSMLKNINAILNKMIDFNKNESKKNKLLINRGFEFIDDLIAKQHAIEGVVAESLLRNYNHKKKHYYPAEANDTLWLTKKLKEITSKGFEVIVIDYASPWDRSQQRQLAKKLLQRGFTPYVSDALLNTLGISTIEPIGKRILGFYDGNEVNHMSYSKCHRLLSMPIEYLGYVPECVDINQANFKTLDLTKYSGVTFWVGRSSFKNNPSVIDWISQTVGKKKILFLGSLPEDRTLLNQLEISQDSDLSGNIEIAKGRQLLLDYSAKTIPQFSPFEIYAGWKLNQQHSKIYLQLKDERSRHSDLIFKTSWGGAAITPMPIATLANTQSSWMLDPFWILTELLQLDDIPVADVTTESGNRIFTTHIDGDGFPSRSGFTKQPYVSEIILEEILKKRQTPHTVSIIEGEVSREGLYPDKSEELEQIAKNIFELNNVQPASHTFSHPFYWNEKTAKQQKSYGDHLPIEGYQLDYVKEIIESTNYVNRLAPKNKKVKLILWSGAADPTEENIQIAEDAGLLNVNGGNTYSVNGDDDFSEVSPTLVWYENAVQVYAPIQNENLHTNLWTEHFDGYSRIIESFKNLNQPKRLKPISLYYHMYSGTYPSSLESLNKAYDWIDTQETTPLHLSEYASRANSLYETGIAKNILGGWQITSTGIKSIRLPKSLGQPVLKNSSLIGWNVEPDGLYLIINNAKVSVRLENETVETANQKRLVKSNGKIMTWKKLGEQIKWRVDTHTPFKMTLRNFNQCEIQSDSGALLDIKHFGRLTHVKSKQAGEIGGLISCSK